MIGARFNMLVVISTSGNLYTCQCDCGNIARVWRRNVYSGNTKSCGCIKRTVSGLWSKFTSEYEIWSGMLSRCYKQKDKAFKNYGARGISVCERWHKFENFLADMGPRPSKKVTLDRIENSGNYCKNNCRWADRITQANNTRKNKFITIGGRTQTISQWSRELGTNKQTYYNRIKKGISPEVAISHKGWM